MTLDIKSIFLLLLIEKKYLYCSLLFLLILRCFTDAVYFDIPTELYAKVLNWFEQEVMQEVVLSAHNSLTLNSWDLNFVPTEPLPHLDYGEVTGYWALQVF